MIEGDFDEGAEPTASQVFSGAGRGLRADRLSSTTATATSSHVSRTIGISPLLVHPSTFTTRPTPSSSSSSGPVNRNPLIRLKMMEGRHAATDEGGGGFFGGLGNLASGVGEGLTSAANAVTAEVESLVGGGEEGNRRETEVGKAEVEKKKSDEAASGRGKKSIPSAVAADADGKEKDDHDKSKEGAGGGFLSSLTDGVGMLASAITGEEPEKAPPSTETIAKDGTEEKKAARKSRRADVARFGKPPVTALDAKLGPVMCVGFLNLNPYKPWLSEENRKRTQRGFAARSAWVNADGFEDNDGGVRSDDADFSTESEDEEEEDAGDAADGLPDGSSKKKTKPDPSPMYLAKRVSRKRHAAPGRQNEQAESAEGDRGKLFELLRERREKALREGPGAEAAEHVEHNRVGTKVMADAVTDQELENSSGTTRGANPSGESFSSDNGELVALPKDDSARNAETIVARGLESARSSERDVAESRRSRMSSRDAREPRRKRKSSSGKLVQKLSAAVTEQLASTGPSAADFVRPNERCLSSSHILPTSVGDASTAIDTFYEEFEFANAKAREDAYLRSNLEETQLQGDDGFLYERAELFIVDEHGDRIVCGVVKFVVAIVPIGRKSERAWAAQANGLFALRVRELKKQYEMARAGLIVRLSIEQGDFLPYGGAELRTSLRVFGGKQGVVTLGADAAAEAAGAGSGPSGDKEKEGAPAKSLAVEPAHTPNFRQTLTLSDCYFPRYALLRVTVFEHTADKPEGTELGSTFLDLEDRFFHAENRKSTQLRKTPLETRKLMPVGYSSRGISTGLLMMRTEVFAYGELSGSALALSGGSLSPAKSAKKRQRTVQLRVAVFDVTDIIYGTSLEGGDTTVNVSLVARLTLNDGSVLEETTDVHRRVQTNSGRAVFNWRLLFDVPLPLQYATLTFIAIANNLIFANEPIGEVLIDLSEDFRDAEELLVGHNQSHVRIFFHHTSGIKLYLPAFPGKVRACLNCEIGIVEAADRQDANFLVGRGREEPNQNPFLDGEDPELLRGRESALMNNAFIDAVVSVARGAWTLAKWLLFFKILAAVIGFIYATLIVLGQIGAFN